MGKTIVVSVYKSEALEHLKLKGIDSKDAILVCSEADFEAAREKGSEVVLLSAPLNVPANVEYLNFALLEKKEAPKTSPKKEEKPVEIKKVVGTFESKAPVKSKVQSKKKDDGKA